MIVDEPTAGLDPEERLRFYRLLSELAADRIVLLSTHIVEDVAVLCPRFAVIRGGQLVANTTPGEAREAIEGTIYEGSIPGDKYEELMADPARCVTQAYLVEGRNRVRVYEPKGNRRRGLLQSRRLLRTRISCRSGPAAFPSPASRSLGCSAMVWPFLTPVTSEVGNELENVGWTCARFRTVFVGDLAYHARRPLFAMWALVLAVTACGLSSGNVRIVSGDASVGGTKAHITSEFALAMQLAIFTRSFMPFSSPWRPE